MYEYGFEINAFECVSNITASTFIPLISVIVTPTVNSREYNNEKTAFIL